jgi:hypothetical protein
VLKVRVLDLPGGNVKKADQWSLFEVLEDRRLPLDLGYSDEDPFAPPHKTPRNH